MKRKNTIVVFLSSIALLMIITIQVFLIKRILVLQTRSFEYQYSQILDQAMKYFEYSDTYNVFGKSEALMQSYAKAALTYFYTRNVGDTVGFRKQALEGFHGALIEKEELSDLLTAFIKKSGNDSDFQSYFVITHLDLINKNKLIPIYDQGNNLDWGYMDTLHVPQSAIKANHYAYERGEYRIEYDFLVDFSQKESIVLQQTTGSLILSILAILLVGFVFFVTFKNLIEEQRLSQSKTDFINNMTHELKTPLSTISIATKSLENEQILSDREKIVNTARMIHRQNRQLSKQINHLLEISMWEKKQFDLDKKWIDLEDFFHGLIEDFRIECKERILTVNESYHLGTSKALMDETQMTVAIHNILINAVKYSHDNPVIEFKASSRSDLTIIIKDNGIGISKEHQKHIFEKFYRVPTGNVHKVKGLGLGLFYVKQIIQAHGGTIDLVSKPGHGSEFTIKLPAHGKN